MNDNPNPNYRPDVVCLQKVISLEEIQKANEIIVNKQQDYLTIKNSKTINPIMPKFTIDTNSEQNKSYKIQKVK